jgi:alanyl aminopeptidase
MTRLSTAALLAATLATPAAAGPLRLDRDVVPLRQAVELALDPASDRYTGSTTIELDVRRPVAAVRLHAQEMTIEAATINGQPATSAPGEEDVLVLTPAAALPVGKATVTLRFANEYDRRAVALYKMDRGGQGYLFTQFQPADARKAFPCFDEPGFKLPYQLTVRHPGTTSAVSNTAGTEARGADGWTTTRFAPTRPLPSYLLALAVGEFEYVPVEGFGVPGRIVTVKGQKHLATLAARTSPPLLKAMEAWFGSPYPFEKLDLIAIPEYWPGAMEHPGAITFAEGILLVDEGTATAAQRRLMARIAAHEFAHMWFGDLVTMSWWDDLWLNESFAVWMGDKIAEEVYPELGVLMSEILPVQATMNADARATARPIRQDIESPHDALESVGLVYNKGKAVLSMLEAWAGRDRVQAGVRAYLQKHAWGNAQRSDFTAALDQATGAKASAVVRSFIEQAGLPRVSVEVVPGGLRLRQQRQAMAGAALPAASWLVPVALRYADGAGVHTRTVLLEGATTDVQLGSSAVRWVYPAADAIGYYRWELPGPQLEALVREGRDRLTTAERVALAGNVSSLLDAGRLDGARYLQVLSALAADPDPDVVAGAVGGLQKVELAFKTDATRAAFGRYVQATLGPALDRVGLEPASGEPVAVTQLRVNLLLWLGERAQEARTLEWAKQMAARYMADPHAVPPSLAAAALRLNAGATGDLALFEEYRKRLEAATVPADRARYVAGLGGFRAPAVRARILEWALSGVLRPNEMLQVPFAFTDSPAGRDDVYTWFTTNYTTFAKRMPPVFMSGLPAFANGCERERVARARDFFGQEGHAVAGTSREVEKLAEQVGNCVALRERELPAVTRFLGDAG